MITKEKSREVYRKMIISRRNSVPSGKAFLLPREIKDKIFKSTYLTFKENKFLEPLTLAKTYLNPSTSTVPK